MPIAALARAALAALWLADAPADAIAAAPAATPVFVRYSSDPKRGDHLDTAIARYHRGKQAVDLVGAVHIGDLAYYVALNRRFARYDKVLFELVAPEEFDVRAIGQADGGVSAVQRWIKDWLQLDFQLDRVNYRARNFVHADLDSARLTGQLAAHAGDILASLLKWSIGDAARLHHADGTLRLGTFELIAALTSADPPRALKRVLGRELAEIDLSAADLGGMGFGSILIGKRNAKAIEVLQRVLGARARKVAIFYGAAHLPDLHRRLIKLGFAPGPVEWEVAWDLR